MSDEQTPPEPDGGTRRRSVTRRLLHVLATIAVPLVAVTAGFAALFGTARLTTRPGAFLAVGFLAYLAAFAAGAWLLTRRRPTRGPRRAATATAVAALVVLVPSLIWLLPPMDAPATPRPPDGVRFWDLSTGSRIAALHFPASGTDTRPDPIVFLHGGPGVADMEHDAAYFRRFAAEGYDVWLYDQVGSGYSGRLADPGEYSLSRDLADLEAVRQQIGASSMILIGHSYGSSLAATYLARYPQHVSRVVFSSPGQISLRADDKAGNGLLSKLSAAQMADAARSLLAPRAYLTWALAPGTPLAARAFAGDAEMDARFVQLYSAAAPGLVCPSSPVPPAPARPGFYANRIPVARSTDEPDIRPMLRNVKIPTLILKGSCDYLSWNMTTEYREVLPQSTFVYLAGVGHQMYFEQPDRYAQIISAFLADRSLPVTPYAGTEAPADFEGPTS